MDGQAARSRALLRFADCEAALCNPELTAASYALLGPIDYPAVAADPEAQLRRQLALRVPRPLEMHDRWMNFVETVQAATWIGYACAWVTSLVEPCLGLLPQTVATDFVRAVIAVEEGREPNDHLSGLVDPELDAAHRFGLIALVGPTFRAIPNVISASDGAVLVHGGEVSTIEEALRLEPPTSLVLRARERTISRDRIEYAIHLRSANRDRKRWGAGANEFLPLGHDSSSSLTFGRGTHRCPGKSLALAALAFYFDRVTSSSRLRDLHLALAEERVVGTTFRTTESASQWLRSRSSSAQFVYRRRL